MSRTFRQTPNRASNNAHTHTTHPSFARARFKNRELQIMRQLVKAPHSNIVGLKHCFYSQGEKPEEVSGGGARSKKRRISAENTTKGASEKLVL